MQQQQQQQQINNFIEIMQEGATKLPIHTFQLMMNALEHIAQLTSLYNVAGVESLSTQGLAQLKGVSESSVSSVKRAIKEGKSEYFSLNDWLFDIKMKKDTKAKEKTKLSLQKMDKSELVDMLASLGIEVK